MIYNLIYIDLSEFHTPTISYLFDYNINDNNNNNNNNNNSIIPCLNDLSTSLLLKKVKNPSLPLFFSSLVCFHLGKSQDWYLQYWPSLVVLSCTHFAIIHPHFIHVNFYFI